VRLYHEEAIPEQFWNEGSLLLNQQVTLLQDKFTETTSMLLKRAIDLHHHPLLGVIAAVAQFVHLNETILK
jgi:hypothetical protein